MLQPHSAGPSVIQRRGATWDTGAQCGVFSPGFGAGPGADELPSKVSLTHAGGGAIPTEGKVRAVPVHTGNLVTVKTGVVGAVTRDLVCAYDDVGAVDSPFVGILDGPRPVLLPKAHHLAAVELACRLHVLLIRVDVRKMHKQLNLVTKRNISPSNFKSQAA